MRRNYDELAAQLDARNSECEGERKPLSAVAIGDFLAMEIPARKHLLKPVLPEQGLMMVHGPRGLGKTHMTVGICVAVASGGKFLRWSAPEPAGVLLIDGEMPASALQERLAKAIQGSDEEIRAPLRIVTPDLNRDSGMPDLSTPTGQASVDALVGEAKLIVLDNLSSLMKGIENDADSWQPLQTWALRHRAQGRSILFVRHSGKGGAQRGTSMREDVLVIGLRRPSDYSQTQGARFEIHVEKGRSLSGEDAESFEAQLTADPHGLQIWTMKSLDAGQDDRINELSGLGMKPAEIARRPNQRLCAMIAGATPGSGCSSIASVIRCLAWEALICARRSGDGQDIPRGRFPAFRRDQFAIAQFPTAERRIKDTQVTVQNHFGRLRNPRSATFPTPSGRDIDATAPGDFLSPDAITASDRYSEPKEPPRSSRNSGRWTSRRAQCSDRCTRCRSCSAVAFRP